MNQYKFTIELIGYGDTPEEAWEDAQEAFDITVEPIPDEYETDENNY